MFRKSILFKLALGLSVIFLFGAVFLSWLVARQEEENRSDQIVRDLNSLKANSEVYIRHLLLLDGQNNDEDSYRRVAVEIVQELYQGNGCHAAAYTGVGELLYAMRPDLFEQAGTEDIRRAMEGTAAFTVFYPATGQMAVVFSMPVEVVEKNIGILRFWVDYSLLYRQGREAVDMVLKCCIAVFGVILVLIFMMLSKVLRPVRRLSGISRQVTDGLKEGRIEASALLAVGEERGADESGRLAEDMETMLRLLDQQFTKMRADRNRILELLNSRQEFYNLKTHELKTPLTVIKGYSGLLKTEGEDKELREKAAEHIGNESARLYQMVLQLLDMARHREDGEKTRVDLNRLAKSVVSAMEMRAGRYGMPFVFDMEEELYITAHEESIRQVLVNLLDNAIKYGKEGRPIRLAGQRTGNAVRLEVANDGDMTPEAAGRIFEPFYRVSKEESREKGSAGLGLSLCRKRMEEQGGEIAVRTGDGQVVFSLVFQGEGSHEEGD